jgi:CheY-like chemotaxis protein
MRIAVVNDVLAAVEAMRRVILSAPENEVAWVARDGSEAVALCAGDAPDLILMDLIMPGMDGVEATRRIMARKPCAIVVVTANVTSQSAKVFEAMGAGALDAVNTPVLDRTGAGAGARPLLGKIETIRKLLGANTTRNRSAPAQWMERHPAQGRNHLVGIGASAGGPTALAKLLAHLPADFPAPVIIVQHVDPHFAPGLAHWLNAQTPLQVRLAREGDRPQAAPSWWLGKIVTLCLQVLHGLFTHGTRSILPIGRRLTSFSRARTNSGREMWWECCSPAWAAMGPRGCALCDRGAIIRSPRIGPPARFTACPAPRRSCTPPRKF